MWNIFHNSYNSQSVHQKVDGTVIQMYNFLLRKNLKVDDISYYLDLFRIIINLIIHQYLCTSESTFFLLFIKEIIIPWLSKLPGILTSLNLP